MTIYIAPESSGETNEVEEIARRAGFPILEVEKVGQLIKREDEPVLIARLSNHNAMVLMRNLSTLLSEPPSVVTNMPGSKHSLEFTSITSSLYPVDWKELEAKLTKSGLLGQDVDSAEKRTPANFEGHKTLQDDVKDKPSPGQSPFAQNRKRGTCDEAPPEEEIDIEEGL
jgi:hypothetical protein